MNLSVISLALLYFQNEVWCWWMKRTETSSHRNFDPRLILAPDQTRLCTLFISACLYFLMLFSLMQSYLMLVHWDMVNGLVATKSWSWTVMRGVMVHDGYLLKPEKNFKQRKLEIQAHGMVDTVVRDFIDVIIQDQMSNKVIVNKILSLHWL